MIEWRTVAGFENYEVSENGSVRRKFGGQGAVAGKEIKWHKQTSTGYPDVRLRKNGKTYSVHVHRLVAETFIGPRTEGLETRHIDGDKMNCRKDNLVYGTPKENGQDKVKHGTSCAGEKNPKSKITKEQALEIRQLRKDGFSAKVLASRFLLSESTIYRIVANIYWIEASNRGQDRAAR